MSRSLTFAHKPDGTTSIDFRSNSVRDATPLPRTLVVDGHHQRPHPDVSAVITWLIWPRYFSGTIAFGSPLTYGMGQTLGALPPHFRVTPYSLDRSLTPRKAGASTLRVANSETAMPQRSGAALDGRVIDINVVEIEQWRGHLASKDSIYVSANIKQFAAQSRPARHVDLAARLAVTLLFADALQVGRIILPPAGFDERWMHMANDLFRAIDIDLVDARSTIPEKAN